MVVRADWGMTGECYLPLGILGILGIYSTVDTPQSCEAMELGESGGSRSNLLSFREVWYLDIFRLYPPPSPPFLSRLSFFIGSDQVIKRSSDLKLLYK